MAPWSMAGSARRMPAIRAATQPPRTNDRKEPNTLNANVTRWNSCQLPIRRPSWCAPTAIPVRPNTSSSATADSAPTQTPLQDRYQGESPSISSLTTSSTSIRLTFIVLSSCLPPRLPFPVFRAAEVVIQPLLVLALQRQSRIELGSSLDMSLRQVHVDLGFLPAHPLDPFRRDQHLAGRQPGPRVLNNVTDRPRGLVDEEVFHVAQVAVGRLDVVAHHVARAPQIRVHAQALASEHLLLDPARLRRGDGHAREREAAPSVGRDPIAGITVVPGVLDLALPVDGPIGVDRRAVLDLLLRQRCPQSSGTGD